jgi:hypothetical protein
VKRRQLKKEFAVAREPPFREHQAGIRGIAIVRSRYQATTSEDAGLKRLSMFVTVNCKVRRSAMAL